MMTRMSTPKYAPFYDLFKLIVAAILTVILILFLLRDRIVPATGLDGPTTPTPVLPRATSTTIIPTVTSRALPTLTSTVVPAPTATALPAPTSGLLSPTQAFPTSDASACSASPSHIQIGDNVRVLSWLNFRTGPGLNWPILHTNIAGTVMQVVGGPFCTPKNTLQGSKAYLWWNVRMANGQEGWSAEAPLLDPVYFLEPVQ
jgi:hypothetical protein